MNEFKAGESAYLDTLRSGLVPCKVLEVVTEGDGKSLSGKLNIEITQDRYAYPKGYTTHASPCDVVPRSHRITRDGKYSVNVNYRWVK